MATIRPRSTDQVVHRPFSIPKPLDDKLGKLAEYYCLDKIDLILHLVVSAILIGRSGLKHYPKGFRKLVEKDHVPYTIPMPEVIDDALIEQAWKRKIPTMDLITMLLAQDTREALAHVVRQKLQSN